ncbi:hypothetical protein KUTeg_002739 [Tegillarca granosa]|uniref:OTU domain-containing protein n=1 Tax=Tegillarca granosa TaxID=220873 RepID=A0ABQ9FSI4_TEGGR|nr:hypothetical protein KUTeg_002739 [Tegillarca granosa]
MRTKTINAAENHARKRLFQSPSKFLQKSPGQLSLAEVKHQSLVTFRARQLVYKLHTRNVDTLLSSNGLRRFEISGDGNCFFNAVSKSTEATENLGNFRNSLCDHLETHAAEYIHFLPNMQDGQWSTDLADALPLATSNILCREITSSLDKPSDFQSTVDLESSPSKLIEIKPSGTVSDIDKNSTPNKQGDCSHPSTITPRKQAKYKSPKQKFRSRKRKARPETWKKNIRKRLRLAGQEYISISGKLVKAKEVKPKDCTKCPYKCSSHISEEARKELFTDFWSLQDYSRQRDFFCSTVSESVKVRTKPKRVRKLTRTYTFNVKGKQLKAREEKTLDKNFAKENATYHAATFDLQSVLHTPCSNVSQVYYKRKLNCYNLSVYSLGDSSGTCFMWNETEGKRGSDEISTCLVMYIKSLLLTTSHVCLYSDNCTGQNRNKYVAAAGLHSVITTENIVAIDQKFLEPGHTEMEVDSMHAAIEAAKKNTEIYVPSQWDTVVRLARKRKPYTKDLLSLCADGTVPEEYHPYYSNLKSSDSVKDTIPEPDFYDDIEDTDDENA